MPIDIHDAAERGNIDAIGEYVRAGGNLYLQDQDGNPPLHVASLHGKDASIAALLEAGVDPDALNGAGDTPLCLAQRRGHTSCARLLQGTLPPVPGSGTSTSLRTAGAHKGDRAKQDPPRKDRKHTGKEKSKMNDTAMPLPPPPAPEQATRVTAKGREEAWHLCHDEHGNAYYYNETSGESLWAGDYSSMISLSRQQALPAPCGEASGSEGGPPGWSLHTDPASGHLYFLNDHSHESVWAESDGSFPSGICGNGQDASASNHGDVKRPGSSENDHDGMPSSLSFIPPSEGVSAYKTECCVDFGEGDGVGDEESVAVGVRLQPCAPELTDTLMESLSVEGREYPERSLPACVVDEIGDERSEQGKEMLLCTSGVMGLNKFFAKRQEEGLFEEQDGDKATDVATPRTPRRAADSSIVWETGAGGSSESDHDRGLSAPHFHHDERDASPVSGSPLSKPTTRNPGAEPVEETLEKSLSSEGKSGATSTWPGNSVNLGISKCQPSNCATDVGKSPSSSLPLHPPLNQVRDTGGPNVDIRNSASGVAAAAPPPTATNTGGNVVCEEVDALCSDSGSNTRTYNLSFGVVTVEDVAAVGTETL